MNQSHSIGRTFHQGGDPVICEDRVEERNYEGNEIEQIALDIARRYPEQFRYVGRAKIAKSRRL